ncbi:MAG TPA: hypothetical protein VF995_10570 [Actinomycetota bacterium]
MTVPVVISALAGAVVGAACMAFWAAERIQAEAARQFDHGFERGRWLSELAAVRALERAGGEHGRTRRSARLSESTRAVGISQALTARRRG